ncbi:MAG: mandelate racemase/muconate lactonizing enzyme family protein [Chromatiales bacterium]|jgi:galactonate dehydratase|nr:mandelate racemase/muconate lactonizing enzyme family protein [Chromatiales bacterium]
MKIVAIDTLRCAEFPNLLWVEVHTDEGVTGLGETYFGARAVEAYIHESCAPVLLGEDPLAIERLSRTLTPYVGYCGTGVETRGRSAIDIALWDVFGKKTRQPIYQLLGGASRDRIRTYNTCAGYRYVRSKPDWGTDDWGLEGDEGPYEDLDAFLHRAGDLAQSLLDEGITGMKIWPLDYAATASDGYYISSDDLDKAMEPFRQIRAAVGSAMDIMVELHALWRFPAALKIAKALEQFDPFWYEDPVRADSLPALKQFADATRVPVCASETVAGRWGHRDLLESGASAIIMPDLVWCGGLSEGRKIAAMADAYHRPVAPHDCTGPVAFMAAVHLSMHVSNALCQESVRAFYSGWYKELVTCVPTIEGGEVLLPEGVGLGTELVPGFRNRDDVAVQRAD